jgi:NAD(P)-dependent dehydrogenase (short-subunit alcohol dehydrogenase family)
VLSRRRPAPRTFTPTGDGEITPLLLDVTDPAQINAAAAGIVDGHTGDAGLAGLVNNAGIGIFGPLEIVPLEQFRRQLEVNVAGQLAITQALLPLLRLARGRIVLIGSIGTRFTPFTGPVSASKSTAATMAEALRQELAPWGVGVVLVEPASIHTEAVDKLARDAELLLRESDPRARALYEEDFRRFVGIGLARERNGSPPQVVARTVARALTIPRPHARYLVGKDSWRMAALAAVLPTPLLDALRRRIGHQPAPGSRAPWRGSAASAST